MFMQLLTFRNTSDFLSRITLWTNIRRAGNQPASRLVILIPLIGYWIVFNKSLTNYVALWWDKVIPMDNAPVPWKLLATYFGLCFVAVASLLYEIFCPAEAKQYASAADHSGARYNYTSDVEYDRLEGIIEGDTRSAQQFHDAQPMQFTIHSLDAEREELLRREREKRLRVLNIYFDQRNRSNFCMRVLIQFLYAVGFLVLLIPAINIFSRVCVELYYSAFTS